MNKYNGRRSHGWVPAPEVSVTHVSPRYSNIYTARLQTVNMRRDLRHPFTRRQRASCRPPTLSVSSASDAHSTSQRRARGPTSPPSLFQPRLRPRLVFSDRALVVPVCCERGLYFKNSLTDSVAITDGDPMRDSSGEGGGIGSPRRPSPGNGASSLRSRTRARPRGLSIVLGSSVRFYILFRSDFQRFSAE